MLSKFLRVAAMAAIATVTTSALQAAPYEFANFNLLNANQPFSFTNPGGSSFVSAISVPVTFNFTVQTGLSTADHQATLTITGPPSSFPALVSGTLVDQPLPLPMTMTIIENGTGLNLLTATLTGDILGLLGSSNASMIGQDTPGGQTLPGPVIFTSAFGTFTPPGDSYVLGLSTLNAPLSIGPGGILSSFNANIDGQFNANFVAVPEPTSLALFALGLGGLIVATRKRS